MDKSKGAACVTCAQSCYYDVFFGLYALKTVSSASHEALAKFS